MRFEVFGKPACAMCKSTKDKLTHLIAKSGSTPEAALTFVDLDTVEGLAEGAFNDVHEVPTVILRSDSGNELARWEKRVPPSGQIQAFLGAGKGAAAGP